MNAAKESYKRFRAIPWETLWRDHVPEFDRAEPRSRFLDAGLIRAVGVVFSESGPATLKSDVAAWLRSLLRDPDEKIRRYAMAALPKIGAGEADEAALIDHVQSASPNERETRHLARALDKIGGRATLEIASHLPPQTALKVRANVTRESSPSRIRLDSEASMSRDTVIHLRSRRGLENFVREELESHPEARRIFRLKSVSSGLVEIIAAAPFRLNDLLNLRCFGSMAMVLGFIERLDARAIASLISANSTHDLLGSLTEGAIRYRLEFPSLGHRRGLVRDIANLAFAECPSLLNDPRQAPWAVEIHPLRSGFSVEVRPRFAPDPRFSYRRLDVPAASHPPLAACMARLAGISFGDVVWDPFCGSGLELIERGLLGGVKKLLGSDLSAQAIEIAKANFQSSGLRIDAEFLCSDFREARWMPGSISQIITNPPMGRRVPIANLDALITSLMRSAANFLKPGGVLVFANPLPFSPSIIGLKLDLRQRIDLGGFDVHLERHIKSSR